jgi:hypothetical protein
MSFWRYDTYELIPDTYEFFNTILTFVVAFILHIILFFILKKTISNLWAACLTLVSLSVYEGFPFRRFFDILLRNLEPPEKLQHTIFSDPLTMVVAILATSTILISISRNISIYTRAIMCAILTFFLTFASVVDALFLSLFFVVYWPVQLHLKNDLLGSLVALFFGLCTILFCIFKLDQVGCNLNCIETPSIYYFGLYLLLPLIVMTFVYGIYRVDPYELFIRFRTLFALLFLELTLVLSITLDPLAEKIFIPDFVLGQVLLHMYYYIPIIYYISKQPAWLSVKDTNQVLNFIKNMISYMFVKRHSEILWCLILLLFLYNIFSNS